MARNNKLTVAALLVHLEDYEQVEFGEAEKHAKMELVKEDEKDILRVHYTWRQEHYIYTESRAEKDALVKAGLTPEFHEQSAGTGKAYWSLVVEAKATSHLWFMNFRRYGWSWTHSPNGEEGYCRGQTYANGTPIAGLARSAEDVIRDSLVMSWTELKTREELPRVFFCQEAEAVLRILLEDAIANRSRHANPSHNNGLAVSYLPAMMKRVGEKVVASVDVQKMTYGMEEQKPAGIFGL